MRLVVSDAEEAGLDRETRLAVFDDMREGMRGCDDSGNCDRKRETVPSHASNGITRRNSGPASRRLLLDRVIIAHNLHITECIPPGTFVRLRTDRRPVRFAFSS